MAGNKKVKSKPKAAPKSPSKTFLFVEVLQMGTSQCAGEWALNSFFTKALRFGTASRCDLQVPFANLPRSVPLFKVGRGHVKVCIDPRFTGFINNGTQVKRVPDYLNPRGALADVFSVQQPLDIELKLGARGVLQFHGFEVIFKVEKKRAPRQSLHVAAGAGRAPLAMPVHSTMREPLAIALALALGLVASVAVIHFLLAAPSPTEVGIESIGIEDLQGFVAPVHFRHLPAIYAEKFDRNRTNRQLIHWVREYEKRMVAAARGEPFHSDIAIISQNPLPLHTASLAEDLQKVNTDEIRSMLRLRDDPKSPRINQFQLPYVHFETVTAGFVLGSLKSQQRLRIQQIAHAYAAVRSILNSEHLFLKRFYTGLKVKTGKFLDVPRTYRLLGAQPSPDFLRERQDYMLSEYYADAARKRQEAFPFQTDRLEPPLWLKEGSTVLPEQTAETIAEAEQPIKNLWHNVELVLNPSLVPPLPTPKPKIDMGEVELLVFSKREQIKSCYDSALRRNENLSGTLVLEWKVSMSGRAQAIRPLKSTLGDSKLLECLKARLTTWRFPKPKHGVVTVSYPFQFVIAPESRTIR